MNLYLNSTPIVKKRRRVRVWWYALLLFGGLATIGIGYLFLDSSLFQVRHIIVIGVHRVLPENALDILRPILIEAHALNFLGMDNLWAWQSRRIDVPTPAFLSAVVQRNFLVRTVDISVQERQRFAVWCFDNAVPADTAQQNCFWFDMTGILFEPGPETEGNLILTIHELGNNILPIGTRITEDRFISNIRKIIDQLQHLGAPISSVVFNRETQELKVTLYQGVIIYLSIRFDPEVNFQALNQVLHTITLNTLEYVDLRVENRIFYKNR